MGNDLTSLMPDATLLIPDGVQAMGNGYALRGLE
jgi:hypothetical protein